ncbi:hypothetical protein CCACVL1_16038 [Corchorus capsularis]|uniref:CCHC-type domain-containing protein n=1 Tax=Corchorus capsularis TaxID=210143 RepID=A0A1R3HZW3_COCAP|nr:hypothetical protein CCACVL1_16038 [Corchorus capsularis]
MEMSPGDSGEEVVIELATNRDEVRVITKFALLGKIVVDRNLNRRGVINVLRSIWSPKDLLDVRDLGGNLYGLSFATAKSLVFAMENGPWSVLGHCLILKKWDVSCANARRIGSVIGRLIEIENPSWSLGVGRVFLRIKVELDVNKPLLSGFWVPREDDDRIWAELKYERLADFCYACGKLGHTEKGCVKEDSFNKDPKFGPWMRVGPLKDKGRGDGVWKRWDEQGCAMLEFDQEQEVNNKWGPGAGSKSDKSGWQDRGKQKIVDSSCNKEYDEGFECRGFEEEVSSRYRQEKEESVHVIGDERSQKCVGQRNDQRKGSIFVNTTKIFEHLFHDLNSTKQPVEPFQQTHKAKNISEKQLPKLPPAEPFQQTHEPTNNNPFPEKQLSQLPIPNENLVDKPSENIYIVTLPEEDTEDVGYKEELQRENDVDNEVQKEKACQEEVIERGLVPVFQRLVHKRGVNIEDGESVHNRRNKARMVEKEGLVLRRFEEENTSEQVDVLVTTKEVHQAPKIVAPRKKTKTVGMGIKKYRRKGRNDNKENFVENLWEVPISQDSSLDALMVKQMGCTFHSDLKVSGWPEAATKDP